MYAKTSAGVGRAPLIDSDRKLVVVNSGGKYAEAAVAGRLFHSATSVMIATSTTLNTTFVGLSLANPTGSGKNIIVHEFSWAVIVPSAGTAVIGLATTVATGLTTQEAASPIQCCRHNYATTVAKTTQGGAITAPVLVKVFSQAGTALITTMQPQEQTIDLGGSIILAPGRALVTDTTVAMAADSTQFSFLWEEVDAA